MRLAHDQVSALSPRGRWSGRLTARPLPDGAQERSSLSPEARASLARHWLARCAAERRVSDAFEVVRRALEDDEAPRALCELAARAVDDELRHAELCREVASRYAGEELAAPRSLALEVPPHPGASAPQRRALHVLGHCALNETFASAVLEHALQRAEGELARAALRELLSDEVDHARLGWGYLAASPRHRRQALAPWLLEVLRANVRSWRETDRAAPEDASLAAHGAVLSGSVDVALEAALRDLVAPGMSALGLWSAELEAWRLDGARG